MYFGLLIGSCHAKNVYHPPMMQTTDISMKIDPSYGPITKHFHQNPEEFHDAFASGQSLNGFILIVDLLNLSFRKVKLNKRKKCKCC